MERHLYGWRIVSKAVARSTSMNRVIRFVLYLCLELFLTLLQAFSINLVSARPSTHATGSIQVKVGFVTPPTVHHAMNFEDIYNELVRRSRGADISLVSAPPVSALLQKRMCIYLLKPSLADRRYRDHSLTPGHPIIRRRWAQFGRRRAKL